ncbi:MAG: thioredoxin reductase [Firmicutes bacterium]|nr:thioredoxin reductase [Bacillota bacterium]
MDKPEKPLDLLIIGAGVAGLTAGIYAARLKLKTLILEDEIVGGQIQETYVVENYPGFSKIKGSELIDKMHEQTLLAGTALDEFDKIVSVRLTPQEKIIETQTAIYRPAAVIIAAGMKRREVPIPEEKKFRGKGIHYCELCDGHMYDGKVIAVVGGGNSAVGAANFLEKYAKKLYIIHHSDKFNADQIAQDQLFSNKKIEVLWNSKLIHGVGETSLSSVIIENQLTKETRTLEVSGVFVQIGSMPKTDLYKDYIRLNESGSIVATETCETNIPGVYAAGDIRTKPIRQLTTAAADGTVAALLAEKYIIGLKKRKEVIA